MYYLYCNTTKLFILCINTYKTDSTADFMLLKDISPEQVLHMLTNLMLPRLVVPFKRSQVNGRLLSQVESVEDLEDIDEEVKPFFAKMLFKNLVAWKKDRGRVPRKLLLPPPPPLSTAEHEPEVVIPLKVNKVGDTSSQGVDDTTYNYKEEREEQVCILHVLRFIILK